MKGFLKFGIATFITAAILAATAVIALTGCTSTVPDTLETPESTTEDNTDIVFPAVPTDTYLFSAMHPDVRKFVEGTNAIQRYTFDMGKTAYAFFEHNAGSNAAARTDIYRMDKETGSSKMVYHTFIPINQYMKPVSTEDYIFWEESDNTADTAVLKMLSTDDDQVNELYSCGVHCEERWYELYSLPEVGENVIGLRYKNYILIYNADSNGELKLPFIPFK